MMHFLHRTINMSFGEILSGTIIGLSSLDVYFGCPVPECNNFKLQPREIADTNKLKLFCDNHDGIVEVDAASKHVVCRFIIDKSDDHQLLTLSAFTPIIRELFDAKHVAMPSLMDRTALKDAILALLPYPLKFSFSASSVVQSILVEHDIL